VAHPIRLRIAGADAKVRPIPGPDAAGRWHPVPIGKRGHSCRSRTRPLLLNVDHRHDVRWTVRRHTLLGENRQENSSECVITFARQVLAFNGGRLSSDREH